MKYKNILSIVALLLGQYALAVQTYAYDQIYSLDESTHIMHALIKSGGLSRILLPEQEPYINFYIDNYSPAYLAFEAEVSSHQNPVLVLCCNLQEFMVFELTCRTLVARYPGLKILFVNDETLPSIVGMLKVQVLPAFIFIDEHNELGRVEGTVDLESDFENLLRSLGI